MFERTSQDALPLVLLIDDDLVSREVTATVLTMSGYTVHTAEGGVAALVLLTAAEGRPHALRSEPLGSEPIKSEALKSEPIRHEALGSEPIRSEAIRSEPLRHEALGHEALGHAPPRHEPLRPDVILMDSQMPGLSGTELVAELRSRSSARIYVVSGSNPPPELTAAADGFLLKPFSANAFRKLLEGGKPEPLPVTFDPNEPVVSAEILAQFRKVMPEAAVREVYQAVVSDLGKRIEALGAAIARGDGAEVRRIGHAIKGGCGMAGAVQAARLGALFESGFNRSGLNLSGLNLPGANQSGPNQSGHSRSGDNQLDNSAALLRELRAATRRLQNMLDAEMPA
jgi:CheY-like chemotaxis protein